MKSLRTLTLMSIMLGVTTLLSQCRNEIATDQQIPYNKEKAQVHVIPANVAAALTAGFRKGQVELGRQLKDTAYLSKSFSMPLAESFNRDAIALLLNQKGAKGVRIYLGQDGKGLIRMVLVAVDERNNDIVGKNGKVMKFTSQDDSGTDDGSGVILEAGQRCPTLCSIGSPLAE